MISFTNNSQIFKMKEAAINTFVSNVEKKQKRQTAEIKLLFGDALS